MLQTILISDNEPAVAEVAHRFLFKAGYNMHKVPQGGARKTIATCRTAPPDLLITDIDKPGMNGLTMCRALRHDPRTHQIPIVVMSGYALAGGAMMAGADAFLPKPFSRQRLLRTVRDLLATRALGPRLRPITSLPPWLVLEEQLHAVATQHDWALLSLWLDPMPNPSMFASIVCSIVEQHSQVWAASDARNTRLLVFGRPEPIEQVQQELSASFPEPQGTGPGLRLLMRRADGGRRPLPALSVLFPEQEATESRGPNDLRNN